MVKRHAQRHCSDFIFLCLNIISTSSFTEYAPQMEGLALAINFQGIRCYSFLQWNIDVSKIYLKVKIRSSATRTLALYFVLYSASFVASSSVIFKTGDDNWKLATKNKSPIINSYKLQICNNASPLQNTHLTHPCLVATPLIFFVILYLECYQLFYYFRCIQPVLENLKLPSKFVCVYILVVFWGNIGRGASFSNFGPNPIKLQMIVQFLLLN